MKVLLVDDDVFVRRMLAKMIPWAELGFTQVLEAENGEVGVYLVEKEHPLLIVTDVRMPLLSGLELTAQARKLTLDTYVIVLSAYNDFEYVRTAVTERVTDYFVIATAANSRQVDAIIDEIEEKVADAYGEHPFSIEGRDQRTWILMDYGSVLVHIFTGETRKFYSLERLWGDAKKIDYKAL